MATWVQTSQFSKGMDAIKEKLATKLEASGVKNNATTTDAGYVLDARMGKTLGDRATTLETKVSDLYFATDSNGKWGYKSTKNGAVTPFRNPTGDAIAAEVLSGKIFSSAALENVAGTMANRGAWTGSTTGNGNVAIPEGYHNGSGYVSGAGAYNAGVTYADGRTNTKSANYKAGYSAGYAACTPAVHFSSLKDVASGWTLGSYSSAVVGKYYIYMIGANKDTLMNYDPGITGADIIWSYSGLGEGGSAPAAYFFIYCIKATGTYFAVNSPSGIASAGTWYNIKEFED